MRILNHINKLPINSLVREVQAHCTVLITTPEQHDIYDLGSLKVLIEYYIHSVATQFFFCNPEKLQGEVHSYQTFEVYNLLYKGKDIFISVIARKTEYEAAFQHQDMKNSE